MNEAKLREELIADEDAIPYAYQDSERYWTIGIGRLVDKRKKGSGLSWEEMEYLLHNDIMRKQALLDKYLPWWRGLSEVRQRALINMAFNLGVGPSKDEPEGHLLEFKNTLKAMQEDRTADVVAGMRASAWHKQVPNRAERIIKLWTSEAA